MRNRTESINAILHNPLDYLHPQRGSLPSLFTAANVRSRLNRIVLHGLWLSPVDARQIERNQWTALWMANWKRLPTVALLMGAQLMWPQLARGARISELEPSVRAFARADVGPRSLVCAPGDGDLEQSIRALGLGVLAAWDSYIPAAFMQRLPLLFAPRVVELQQTLPAQEPNASLFLLAVQHARLHQNA